MIRLCIIDQCVFFFAALCLYCINLADVVCSLFFVFVFLLVRIEIKRERIFRFTSLCVPCCRPSWSLAYSQFGRILRRITYWIVIQDFSMLLWEPSSPILLWVWCKHLFFGIIILIMHFLHGTRCNTQKFDGAQNPLSLNAFGHDFQ